MRQSQIVQSAIYGFDTVVTQVPSPPGVLFLGSQLGLFPLQIMSGQKLDETILALCMFLFEFSFKDNLQLPFGFEIYCGVLRLILNSIIPNNSINFSRHL